MSNINQRKLKTITHDKARPIGEYLSISNQGFTFGASFIRNNKLEDMKSVKFLEDPEDPYFYAFEFLENKHYDVIDAYKLTRSAHSATATRQCNAKAVINSSKQLSSVRNSSNRAEKAFDIKPFDPKNNIFFVSLTPSFEFCLPFSEIKNVSKDVMGIYRCLDESEAVIYIGSGLIKQEAINAQNKSKEHRFKFIEYSILSDREAAFDWEHYHQKKFSKKYGNLPILNKVYAPYKGKVTYLKKNEGDD